MGHRKKRKRDRRGGTRVAEPGLDNKWLLLHDDLDPFDAFIAGAPPVRVDTVKACGTCKEFVEDHEGGRGTCLHPGSGILSPWTDTGACDFYLRSGRR